MFELRNICLIDPDTDEFVQLTYFCEMDSSLTESDLLEKYKTIKGVGLAKDSSIMKLGVYPIYLCYSKNGAIKREKENDMSDFVKVEGNVYKPNKDMMGLLARMKKNNKKRNAA